MYCRQCGYNNDRYSKLCHRCGSLLAADAGDSGYTRREDTAEGELKYARKQEKFAQSLKSRFRKMERVAHDNRRSIVYTVTAAVAVLAIAAVVLTMILRSTRTEEIPVYGSDSGNVAHRACACADDNWLYYSLPGGENPGLYKVSRATGDELKLSYIRLSQMSLADGWIYGTDDAGCLMRISTDGLTVQELIADDIVSYLNVVNDTVYYIGMDDTIYTASMEGVGRRGYAIPEQLLDVPVASLYAYNGYLYYQTKDSTDDPVGTVYETPKKIDPSEIPDSGILGDIHEQEQSERHTIMEVSGSDLALGTIRRMAFDGSGDTELCSEQMCSMTVEGDYVYCQSPIVRTVSASDVDAKAPSYMTVDRMEVQCWRVNLDTLRLTKFIPDAHVASPINPADGAIYYIGMQGNLMTATPSGDDIRVILTDEPQVISVCTVGDWLYYLGADGGMGRIRMDGTDRQQLC